MFLALDLDATQKALKPGVRRSIVVSVQGWGIKMKLLPPKEDNEEEKTGASPDGESALFGLAEAALQELIRSATESGCVTYDQIDALLRSDDAKSEQIEDILAKFTEMGVSVIESGSNTDIETKGEATTSTEPKEEFEAENQSAVVRQRAVSTTQSAKAPAERTDDPLRSYLRDMGSIELLSREGEVAIAKRIEAGREAMMAGLCESSLTFQAISIWRDEAARSFCVTVLTSMRRLLIEALSLRRWLGATLSAIRSRTISPANRTDRRKRRLHPLSAVRSPNQLAIERQQATRLSARATSTKTTRRSGFRSALRRPN